MLKQVDAWIEDSFVRQPPSGGCVLKLEDSGFVERYAPAAAFGRLCVETMNGLPPRSCTQAAAFGRLCVETANAAPTAARISAAAFGRLCVETLDVFVSHIASPAAAFGRLCVET